MKLSALRTGLSLGSLALLLVFPLVACSTGGDAAEVGDGQSGDGDGDASTGAGGSSGGSTSSGGAEATGGEQALGGSEATGGTSSDAPQVDPGMGGDPPELGETARIHIAGDSTAAVFPEDDPTGRVGWGVPLRDMFDETILVNNQARSGRSSKSYYDEGHWSALKAQINEGDYVFIQFGHNDEKFEDPTRYTDPATTYRDYLNVYIGESRQLGAFPVLLTPIARLKFTGNAINSSHGNYPAAMMEVATASNTPLIDMEAKTTALFEMWGPAEGATYFATADQTHTNALGAVEVAGLVVEGIEEEAFPIAARLLPE